jgi:hypothetical protein
MQNNLPRELFFSEHRHLDNPQGLRMSALALVMVMTVLAVATFLGFFFVGVSLARDVIGLSGWGGL